jgi:TonB family protein
MSYQALLFCPDEKTARTVTQVLGDLDFNVTACTEPFAAVKKFMGERFDAVVVDCDNEQNATLLFKSARSAPNNQGALAVAVVEGQAGVAKAFRIGANLVLTKPINVEQAKGTLRVARGLLRKNEGAKPATGTAGTTARKPSAQAPVPAKSAPPLAIPSAAEMRTAALESRMPAPPVVPVQKPMVPPSVAASDPFEMGENAELGVGVKSTQDDTDLVSHSTTTAHSGAGSTGVKIATATAPQARISSGFAASAPAPARAPKESGPAEPAKTIEPANQEFKTDSKEHTASPDKTSAPAPTLTFGGTVGSAQKTASSGIARKLTAVVAVILIAAAGYAAWMKWGPAIAARNAPAKIATQPAPTTAPVAPTRNAENTPSVPQTQTIDIQASDTQSSRIQRTANEKGGKVTKTESHPAKVSAALEATNQDTSVVAETALPAPTPAAQPIVIKNGSGKAAIKATESTDTPALSLTAVAPSGGALPNLISPTPTPTPVLQHLVVSQGVSRGLLVKQVQPVYPRTALEMRIEGAVELMATIAKTGNISTVRVLSGDKELSRAAIDAVKQWKYKPYLLNGEPVDIQTQITVKFKLPE